MMNFKQSSKTKGKGSMPKAHRKEKVMKIKKQSDELHPHGSVSAQVIEVEEHDEGQFGPYFTLKYMTKHKLENGENAELWERCSQKLTPQTKLGLRIVAIMNYDGFDAIPAEFDTDDLVGQLCTLMVDHVKKDDRTYANIISVVPFEKLDSGNAPAPSISQPVQAPSTIDDIPF